MQTVLKQYIRNKKNDPRGVVVAVKSDGEVFYGYSLCNPCDKYDKNRGMTIAVSRALSKDGYSLPESSGTVKEIIQKFLDLEKRAIRYFKDIDPDKIRFDAE